MNEGDAVATGDVIGLVEVMKTYYEVKADQAGIADRFLIEDAEPVDAGDDVLALRDADSSNVLGVWRGQEGSDPSLDGPGTDVVAQAATCLGMPILLLSGDLEARLGAHIASESVRGLKGRG